MVLSLSGRPACGGAPRIAAQQTRCITADTRHMPLLAGIYGCATGVRRIRRENRRRPT
jgi:hypothetical protein